jgi:hypothetical protein
VPWWRRSGARPEVAGQEQRLGLIEHRDRAFEIAVRPQQGGLRGVPAMAALQQRRPIAELAGGLEMPRGRVELAVLAQNIRQADMQIADGGEHRTGVALDHGRQGANLVPPIAVGYAANAEPAPGPTTARQTGPTNSATTLLPQALVTSGR